MKLTCELNAISPALRAAARAVPARTTMPILGTVRIEADQGTAQITGTDLELGIRARFPATVAEPGAAALPAKLVTDIIANADAGPVEIAAAGGNATITTGNARFEVIGMPADDFPVLADPDPGQSIHVPAPALARILQATAFAIGTDDTRPSLTGALLTIDAGTIRSVATDGGRLAIASAALPEPARVPFSGIVPRASVAEILRIASGDADLTVSWRQDAMFVDTNATRVQARLIEGKFPDYSGVVASARQNAITVSCDTDALARALRRVSVAAARGHLVTLRLDGQTLVLTANAPDIGSGTDRVAVTASGDPVTIAFNATFLLDSLEAVQADRVTLTFRDPLAPATITPADTDDPLCVLAPVRTSS